jgi:hypothetical protein
VNSAFFVPRKSASQAIRGDALEAMTARRNRRRHESHEKQDSNSGIFAIPASSRVARRGSTRVDLPADEARPGRGGARSNEA